MSKTVVIKNTSPDILSFEGIPVSPSEQVNVNDGSLIKKLSHNSDFITCLHNGELIINNGIKDLSPYLAIHYLRERFAPNMIFFFNDNNRPYWRRSLSSYAVVGQFIFPGYDQLGMPKNVSLLGYSYSRPTTFRILDITNLQTIIQCSFPHGRLVKIVTSGSLSHVSADEAVWEFQWRGDRHTTVNAYSLQVNWPEFAEQIL